jgi:hypothetical protein
MKRKLTAFIVAYIPSLQLMGSDWPKDYCFDSCLEIMADLKKAFPKMGWRISYTKKCGFGERKRTRHSWIQSRNGIIVDPTAKQFSERLPYVSMPGSHSYSFYTK